MGTSIQSHGLSAEDFGGKEGCNDYLVVTRPDVIRDIHASFLEVGCDVIETDTFNASRLRLAEYALGDRTQEINQTAAGLARQVADRYSSPEKPRFVAGSIGPTGKLLSSDDPALADLTFDELADVFRGQAAALLDGGVDLLIVETMFDMLELKAAIFGIRRAISETGRRVPIQAQVTLDTSGRMLFGNDIAAVCTTLNALDVDIVGLNCSTGPEYMREPVRYLSEHCTKYLSTIPNAGIPLNTGGEAVYPLTPDALADALYEFADEFGVNVVGGCCGTTPEHLSAVVQRIGSRAPKEREPRPEPSVASGVRSVTLHQEPAPLLVGERVNSQGSRRVKRMLLTDDYESIVTVAREQVDGGAHVLDVCVALTERSDEAEQMSALVKKLSLGVEAPLVIDSTDAAVINSALKRIPGRAIVNSINLENGRERVDAVLPLVRDHGAVVVALTIDEEGMAREVDHKVRIAKRIYDIAVNEFDLTPSDLIFDALTLPLTTGDVAEADTARNTIEGIRRIEEECPGVLTVLGISNVSFGIAPHARAVLNSVFLYHTVQAGLDLAIVHPKDIIPYAEIPSEQRRLAEDLIYNRREDALARFIEYFERHEPSAQEETAANPMEGMEAEERIHYQILHRKKDGVEANIDEALTRQDAVGVLNTVLLPAMKEVGDKFGAGELILPFVLQSAEVMKKAVAHLEQFLEKVEGVSKGTVVLATVFGDVHDIGKNLVNTILSNNGYTVHDLGKQVPINTILDRAVEVKADAIGLSALLVSTSKQMPLVVKEQDARCLGFPVLVGGAAINRDFGRRISLLDDGERFFEPGLFYAKDAFEGLQIMESLADPRQRAELLERTKREALKLRDAQRAPVASKNGEIQYSDVKADRLPMPRPPFWGTRVVRDIDPAQLWASFDLRSLYRLSWGAANTKGEAFERLVKDDFEPRLHRYQAVAIEQGLLDPRFVYGYFPAAGCGNDVIVYDPHDPSKEVARFTFTRQAGGEHLSLADYVREPQDGRAVDLIALQVVTVGTRAAEQTEALQRAGEYSESYFLHGFSVQSAEALAEYCHRHIRTELGLESEQGKRYSWGYGACPDLSQHTIAFKLLDASNAIGVSLTEAFQIVPEQSTAAIVMHHPRAAYFNAAATRELTSVSF